ncbi:LysR family transcriptional regulator [Pantoea alhagi]|uniref:LysR family transcriptional regulator n=1 Tax=Pantoea alhagi TaxID=1891675 RepID=A0A1W6BB07_9GAMM|nr:LysR family transcriptional regulator [Pantoea alhagi]ARJ44254.1 LysR family transcriptional regulator [Pantoea alhagi]
MQPLENITAMMVFARVVETQSFTEAANSLGLSKSFISKEIAQLEIRLGVKLLERTTRRMVVTEVGRAWYQFCARALQEVQGADAFIRDYHQQPAGNLSIIAPVNFGRRCIVPSLNAFVAQHIHVQVDLDLTDRPVDLQQERYDLAVVVGQTPPAANFHQLTQIEWGLFAAPDYPVAQTPVSHPQQLPRHDYLLFRGAAHTLSLPFRQGKQKLNIDVHSRFRINNSEALLSAAIAGAGIAYLPCYITHEAQQQRQLVRLLPDWQMDDYYSYLVVRQSARPRALVAMFCQQLQAALASDHCFSA